MCEYVWWLKADILTGGGAWWVKACYWTDSPTAAAVELTKAMSGVYARWLTHPDGRGPTVVVRCGIVAVHEVDEEARKLWLMRARQSKGKLLEATEKGDLPLIDEE